MLDTAPLPPLAPQDWPASLAHLQGSFASRLNIYKVMAHHPGLLEGWVDLRAHIVTKNALGAVRLEVAVLRIAAMLQSAYEWSHHVSRAREVGLTPDRIWALAGDTDRMDPSDALIATAVDQVLADSAIDPDTLDALTDLVTLEGVFDLIAVVGFYKILGAIITTFDVPLDDDVAEVPFPGTH